MFWFWFVQYFTLLKLTKWLCFKNKFIFSYDKLMLSLSLNALTTPAVWLISGPVVVGWVRILSLLEFFLQGRAGSTIVNFQKNNENVRSDNQPGLLLKLTFVRFQNTFLEDVLCPQPKVFWQLNWCANLLSLFPNSNLSCPLLVKLIQFIFLPILIITS